MAWETIFFITISNDSTWGLISVALHEVKLQYNWSIRALSLIEKPCLRSRSGQPSSLARMVPESPVLRLTLSLPCSLLMARSQSQRPGLDLRLGLPSTLILSFPPRLASRSPRTSWCSSKNNLYLTSEKQLFSHQVFFWEIVDSDIFQVYFQWICIQLWECYQESILFSTH